MEFGKRVSDLEIDNDIVLLSNDISSLSAAIINNSEIANNVINSEDFKLASNQITNNVLDAVASSITSFIDVDAISNNVKDAMKQILDDYVLKKMLSNLMFDIISTYNDTVIDCLDGSPDGNADIDAGGAY